MIQHWFVRFGCAMLLVLSLGSLPARASFHFYDIVEVYSSADGSVQFIEMFTTSNFQNLASTGSITTLTDANSYDFPTNLPSGATANTRFLIGTTSYNTLAVADVNVPLPDYTVPDNFFSPLGDRLKLFQGAINFDTITFNGFQLPTAGINSLNHAFGVFTNTFFSAVNSPTNFAGVTGVISSADFEPDGDVDGIDFLALQRGLGTLSGASPSDGDANGDGAVNAADLAIWEQQYQSAGPLSAAIIPEPTTAALLLLGLVLGLNARNRHLTLR